MNGELTSPSLNLTTYTLAQYSKHNNRFSMKPLGGGVGGLLVGSSETT